MVVTFRTTRHDRAMSLLGASDPVTASSNPTVTPNEGRPRFSVRQRGTLPAAP
ncbi:hypothetical protein [Streptomyces sp. bgisy022]|uniref:hypothetical protein n=1 Tax=Streptomyces sp. bgisy022 TaxID=3413769 RepID=UPI003D74D7E0